MGPVSATTPIDVPRERAFELLSDLAYRPALLTGFADEFRLERIESAGVGAAARFRIPERNLWVETVIEELDSPHLIVERGRGSRFDRLEVSTVWELREGPSSGSCVVKVTFWTGASSPFDRVKELRPGLERFYRRSWQTVLERLREALESEAELERVAVAGGDLIPGAG